MREPNRYRGLCHCGEHAWAVLTKGYVTFVSPEDAHFLMSRCWHAVTHKRKNLIYVAAGGGVRGEHASLHRLILGADVDYGGDHKDHDGTNNWRGNLRPCSQTENAGNGRYRLGASWFRGVHKTGRRWRAHISINGTSQYLGTFATREKAARAYDAAARRHFGEFAITNFPQNIPGASHGRPNDRSESA